MTDEEINRASCGGATDEQIRLLIERVGGTPK
jgi:hypothetical protein